MPKLGPRSRSKQAAAARRVPAAKQKLQPSPNVRQRKAGVLEQWGNALKQQQAAAVAAAGRVNGLGGGGLPPPPQSMLPPLPMPSSAPLPPS